MSSCPDASPETLLSLEYMDFMRDGAAQYAVAWSFVQFLMNGDGGKHRDAFLKFVAGCPQQCSRADFERIVGHAASLTKPWRAYCQEFLVPTARDAVMADRKARGLDGTAQ